MAKTIKIMTPLDIVNRWPFFLQGLQDAESLATFSTFYTERQFFRTLNWVTGHDPASGFGVVIALFDSDEPVAYGGAYRNDPPFSEKKWFHIFCAYSKTRNTKDTQSLVEFAEQYGKNFNYDCVSCCSVRLNGFGKRFYHEKLGFKLWGANFYKNIKND